MNAAQTTLVIGGTSGLGWATAELLSARGDTVIIAGRDRARAQSVAEKIGPNLRGIAIDLTDQASLDAAAQAIDHLDHLVLSAAALTYSPFQDLTVEQAQQVFEAKF